MASEAAQVHLPVLTGIAHWVFESAASGAETLRKNFGFRDAPDAARFRLQMQDLQHRAKERRINIEEPSEMDRVLVIVQGTSARGQIGRNDIDVAFAADDLAANLQLKGRWS